jgi:hypothetical protein
VILTYDENGGYPHPDHVMTHKVSIAAWEAAGDPERYPGAGDPWQPLKLYYHMGFSRGRMALLHEAMVERGLESPYAEWLKEWDGEDEVEGRITTRVECAEWFDRRDQALIAHATQVDPTGWWFAAPLELRQQIWPTEEYELARSLVDTELPASGRGSGRDPRPARRGGRGAGGQPDRAGGDPAAPDRAGAAHPLHEPAPSQGAGIVPRPGRARPAGRRSRRRARLGHAALGGRPRAGRSPEPDRDGLDRSCPPDGHRC